MIIYKYEKLGNQNKNSHTQGGFMPKVILIKKGSASYSGAHFLKNVSVEKKEGNSSFRAPNAGYKRRPRANASNWV